MKIESNHCRHNNLIGFYTMQWNEQMKEYLYLIFIAVELTIARLKYQSRYSSINECMGKENTAYIYHGILVSLKERISTAFSHKMKTSKILILRKVSQSPKIKLLYIFSVLWKLICNITNTHIPHWMQMHEINILRFHYCIYSISYSHLCMYFCGTVNNFSLVLHFMKLSTKS